MKKLIISLVLCTIVSFVCGCATGFHGCESKYRLVKANANTIPYKVELINAQREALDAADHVMGENELFDKDGSDTMAKYLRKAAIVDSLYNIGD